LDPRSDEELIRSMAADRTAFSELYRRHADRVIAACARRLDNPEDVADAVATVFIAVFESAGRYQPERGRATAWLAGISANVAAEQRRRRAREAGARARLSGRALLEPDDFADLEARLDANADARRLYAAMQALSAGERSVLELVALEELSVSDAAAVLGIRAGTARTRLARARRRMRGLLDQGPATRPAAPIDQLPEVAG
jgi:RNA polymerase sigma factor (sigma-70 family)